MPAETIPPEANDRIIINQSVPDDRICRAIYNKVAHQTETVGAITSEYATFEPVINQTVVTINNTTKNPAEVSDRARELSKIVQNSKLAGGSLYTIREELSGVDTFVEINKGKSREQVEMELRKAHKDKTLNAVGVWEAFNPDYAKPDVITFYKNDTTGLSIQKGYTNAHKARAKNTGLDYNIEQGADLQQEATDCVKEIYNWCQPTAAGGEDYNPNTKPLHKDINATFNSTNKTITLVHAKNQGQANAPKIIIQLSRYGGSEPDIKRITLENGVDIGFEFDLEGDNSKQHLAMIMPFLRKPLQQETPEQNPQTQTANPNPQAPNANNQQNNSVPNQNVNTTVENLDKGKSGYTMPATKSALWASYNLLAQNRGKVPDLEISSVELAEIDILLKKMSSQSELTAEEINKAKGYILKAYELSENVQEDNRYKKYLQSENTMVKVEEELETAPQQTQETEETPDDGTQTQETQGQEPTIKNLQIQIKDLTDKVTALIETVEQQTQPLASIEGVLTVVGILPESDGKEYILNAIEYPEKRIWGLKKLARLLGKSRGEVKELYDFIKIIRQKKIAETRT